MSIAMLLVAAAPFCFCGTHAAVVQDVRAAIKPVVVGIREIGGHIPGQPSRPTLIKFDPYTFKQARLYKDDTDDFVCTGSMGAVDSANGRYFTLMQPPGTAGIHLARFDLTGTAGVVKTIVPLNITVAFGHTDAAGYVVGIDEMDSRGPYYTRLDPLTGMATVQTHFGRNFTMDGGMVVAVDRATDTMYASMAPAHGGNTFTLFTIDIVTGKLRVPPIVLGPTPDMQGPSGLMLYHPPSTVAGPAPAPVLLAFLPDLADTNTGGSNDPPGVTNAKRSTLYASGGWQLVSIDPVTGKVSATAGMSGAPQMRVIVPGSSYIVPKADGSGGTALYSVLAGNMGEPPMMLAIDIECALSTSSTSANCTESITKWPTTGFGSAPPMDIGLYTPA